MNDLAPALVHESVASGREMPDGAWALLLGTRDRRLARPLAGCRVVMNDRPSWIALPRASFAIAVWLVAPGSRDLDQDALVLVRNALDRDATLHLIAAVEVLPAVDPLAEAAGFSRRLARTLSRGYGVLQLQR